MLKSKIIINGFKMEIFDMRKLLLGLTFCTMPVLASSVNRVYWPQEKLGRDLLLKNGYHDIHILYIQPLRCPNNVYDQDRVGFRAISKENHIIEGTVCDGNVYESLT